MYSAEPLVNVPGNEHTTIWRYMDFTKLVSLLEKRALYFARSDRFSDKFEGATPKPSIKAREASLLDSVTPLIIEDSKVWSHAIGVICKWMILTVWHVNSY